MQARAHFLLACTLALSALFLSGCVLFPHGLPTQPGSVPAGGFEPAPVVTTTPPVDNPPPAPTNGSDNASFNASQNDTNSTGLNSSLNASQNDSNSSLNTSTLYNSSSLEILFFNVGFSDATLVREGEFTMLIDAGSPKSAEQLAVQLNEVGVRHIDVLVLSDFGSDKIGGLATVLRRFKVLSAWHDGAPPPGPLAQDAMQQLSDAQIPLLTPQAGQTFHYGNLTVDVFNPQAVRYGNNPQADALVIRLSYGSWCAFLPSDLPQEQEPSTLSRLAGPCQLLKWRYHGAGQATPSLIYDRLQPDAVLISVGPNDEGLPSPTTLERLRLANATLWRTDLNGSLYVNATGQGNDTLQPADLPSIGQWYNWTYPSTEALDLTEN